MKLQLIEVYKDNIIVEVEPSARDIEYKLFNKNQEFMLTLPCTYVKGKRCKITFKCLNCGESIDLEICIDGFSKGRFYNIIRSIVLSSLEYKLIFLENFLNVFNNISIWDGKRFIAYKFKNNGTILVFYVKCKNCDSKYLISYEYIDGIWPESGRHNKVSPDSIYMDQIVWVEFDENEFFEEIEKYKV